ncbi:MAG: hypothetical protein SF123_02430 [Chloroflexota bacterium]|nr:hypothetical protein [Chloroflexota bacterium]
MFARKLFTRLRIWQLLSLGMLMFLAIGVTWWHSTTHCGFPHPTVSVTSPLNRQVIDIHTASQLDMKLEVSGVQRTRVAFSPDDQYFVSLGQAYSSWGKNNPLEYPSHCSVTWILNVPAIPEFELRPQVVSNNSEIVVSWVWSAPEFQFSRQGNVLAVNNTQKQIIDVSTGEELDRLNWDSRQFSSNSMLFSPDGRWLFTATDRRILVWNAATFDLDSVLEGHTEDVRGLGFSQSLVSTSNDGTIRSWDLDTGESTILYQGSPQLGTSLAVASNGNIAISGIDYAGVIDGVSGRELMQLEPGIMEFSPNGRYIMSYRNDEVRIWDMENRSFLGLIDEGGDSRVMSAAFDPTSQLVAIAFSHALLNIYSTDGDLLSSYQVLQEGEITDIAFSHNGTLVALSWGSDDRQRGGIHFWGVR